MSSNLLKQYRVTVDPDETRVIDTNELVQKKIEEISRSMQESVNDCGLDEFETGFTGGIAADKVSALLEEDSDGVLEEGVSEGNVIKAVPEAKEVPAGPSEEEINQMIEERMQQANAEAERIIADTQAQAAKLAENVKAQAKKEGYEAGLKQAEQENAKIQEELQRKAEHLDKEFDAKVSALEPEFIDTITRVYEEIFHTDLKEYQPILKYLIETTIKKADSDRDFIVHISPDDYQSVLESKEELKAQAVHSDATLEVVEDMTVAKGQCMIETENGVFDCGIGTQLEELRKRLHLLSFTRS